jgi:beta-lactamase regulating signal transducer with metallopeptidase domain
MTVVWALTWLGQSAALAALTAAFVRLPAHRSSAAARHIAWALSFFLCAGLLAWPLGTAGTTGAAIHSAPEGAAFMAAADSFPLVVLPEPVIAMSGWLGWVWVFGAAGGLALAGLDVWRVLRLKRRTVPLTPQEHARLGGGLSRRTLGRAPCLAWCDHLDAPAVLGFSRPVIALPRPQMSFLTDEQARLVVLHELAHVRRGDDWRALAERIVLALTWVNPAVHWLHREVSLSREMACDEWVVRRTAAPVAYAKCLTDAAGLRTQGRRLRLAAGATGSPGALRRRIVGVLALDGRAAVRAVAIAAWLAPVAVCVVAAGLLQLPPVFVVSRTPAALATKALSAIAEHTFTPVSVTSVASEAPSGPTSTSRRRPTPAREGGPVRDAAVQAGNDLDQPAYQSASLVAQEGQETVVSHDPLPASPLPGTGAAGVVAASGAPGTIPAAPAPRDVWWSGPQELGEATGGAAAAAGRATASFFKRVGSSVPALFTQ